MRLVEKKSTYIKAGGDNNDIKVIMCPVLQLDTLLVKADDGVVLDVHHVDILAIELSHMSTTMAEAVAVTHLLVVCPFQARSLDTKRMRWFKWSKEISLSGILNA